MSIDAARYLETANSPWGQMFYRIVFSQLPEGGSDALDFGSGLGITANHLAAQMRVVAIEPDAGMIEHRVRDNEYEQLHGSVSLLAGMEERFDLVVCHNVLEYVDDRETVIRHLAACVKPGGILSVIKHNPPGKIAQAAVYESDPAKALALYRGGESFAVTMGRSVNTYPNEELIEFAAQAGLTHAQTLGIRNFYALGNNAVKYTQEWQRDMFKLEKAVHDDPAFVATAYFHHLLFIPS